MVCCPFADRELDEILKGAYETHAHLIPAKKRWGHGADRKGIGEDDLCPICYDGLQATALQHLTWCKNGCGQSVHGKCMLEWVHHQKKMDRVRPVGISYAADMHDRCWTVQCMYEDRSFAVWPHSKSWVRNINTET
jgi:hypothetical protein